MLRRIHVHRQVAQGQHVHVNMILSDTSYSCFVTLATDEGSFSGSYSGYHSYYGGMDNPQYWSDILITLFRQAYDWTAFDRGEAFIDRCVSAFPCELFALDKWDSLE